MFGFHAIQDNAFIDNWEIVGVVSGTVLLMLRPESFAGLDP